MTKLGLQINRIYEGITEMLSLNKFDEWSSLTRDTGDYFKPLNILNNKIGIVYFVFFSEIGSFICIIRQISGRGGDQIAAWIFVPKEVAITGDELEFIVNKTAGEIAKTSFEKLELTQLFSKEYNTEDAFPVYKRSNGDTYAFRYYGNGTDYSFKEILSNIYQDYYTEYTAVFLLDKASSITCNGADLTQHPLNKWVTLHPKQDQYEFRLLIDGKEFTKPTLFLIGTEITVSWERQGYVKISKKQVVREGLEIDTIKSEEIKKIISLADFIVKDENGLRIKIVKINIDNQHLNNGYSLSVNMNNTLKHKICISADGYNDCEFDDDLQKTPVIKKLERKTHKYIFNLPTKYLDSRTVAFVINTKNKLTESPIEGYNIEGNPTKNGDEFIYYLRFSRPKTINNEPAVPVKENRKLSNKLYFVPIWLWFIVVLGFGVLTGLVISEYFHKKHPRVITSERQNNVSDENNKTDSEVKENKEMTSEVGINGTEKVAEENKNSNPVKATEINEKKGVKNEKPTHTTSESKSTKESNVKGEGIGQKRSTTTETPKQKL